MAKPELRPDHELPAPTSRKKLESGQTQKLLSEGHPLRPVLTIAATVVVVIVGVLMLLILVFS